MNLLISKEPFIMAIAKEQLRQIISENNMNSVFDIYSLFSGGFKDMIQELLETEMEASTGYTKYEKNNGYIANIKSNLLKNLNIFDNVILSAYLAKNETKETV